jgi:hypothetical protein
MRGDVISMWSDFVSMEWYFGFHVEANRQPQHGICVQNRTEQCKCLWQLHFAATSLVAGVVQLMFVSFTAQN